MSQRLTIGAFARRTGLSISALRFYDRVGLLQPVDVDAATGYRRYDEAQIEDATLLRDLRRLQMPMADIQAFLAADADVRHKTLLAHLEHKSAELRSARDLAAQLRARLSRQETPPPMSTMTVDTQALAEAIDQVVPAAGTDPEHPLLQTVLVEASEGSLRLVATDRYRLAVRDLVVRGEDGATFRAVVASAGLRRVRGTLDVDGGGVVTVRHDGPTLVVGSDDAAGRLTVVPAEFPAYEKLLVLDAASFSAVVDRAELTALLERVLDRDVLRLRVGPGRLSIADAGEVAASYDGPELTIGLHPAFAHYAVSAAIGPEVMIEVTEVVKPVVFRSVTDSSFVCMVMPIRLDE